MNNEFRRPTAPNHPQHTHQAVALPSPSAAPAGRLYFKPRPAQKPNPLWQRLQLLWLVVAVLAGSFVAQTLAVGILLLVVYAVVAFVVRIPSRTTFTLALLLLVAISILLLVKPNRELASNFATYAFILLIIGVVTLGRESKMPKRMRRNRRR